MSSSNFLLKSFPPPAFMRMPAVGLDISHRSVRFVELVRTIHGLSLGRYAERRFGSTAGTASTATSEDDISANKELRAALASLKKDFKLSFVNVSLPEDKAYLFTLSLPNVQPSKMREAIEFRLEENVPLAPTEVIFDYTPADAAGKVVVTAYPKRVIENYRKLFADTGLVPLSFSLSAEAIAAAVVPEGSKGTKLIVNIGQKSTGIYVVVDDVLQFTSALSFGGEALTSAIAKHFNVSVEQALDIKNSEDFLKRKNTMQLFFSMANSVSALRDEISRVAGYWQTHKGGTDMAAGAGRASGANGGLDSLSAQTATALAPQSDGGFGGQATLDPKLINKIILCGGDAHLRGLDQYLLTTLGVPVEIANVWTNAFSLDHTVPEIHFANSLDYAAAAGLSLETLHSKKNYA